MAAEIERKNIDTSAIKGVPIVWVMGKKSVLIFIKNGLEIAPK